jgi:hypothetical protein
VHEVVRANGLPPDPALLPTSADEKWEIGSEGEGHDVPEALAAAHDVEEG